MVRGVRVAVMVDGGVGVVVVAAVVNAAAAAAASLIHDTGMLIIIIKTGRRRRQGLALLNEPRSHHDGLLGLSAFDTVKLG
jgi:uncharacterized protein (DUF1778 family)